MRMVLSYKLTLFWGQKETRKTLIMLLHQLVYYMHAAVFSVITQGSSPVWGGALHDYPKNSCIGDYPSICRNKGHKTYNLQN